ncbi:hypothetical protein JXQ31_13480 [candidate division KSB1 bacterium]|nr:hypothetical protein [candidate division KSB1 bacterium]
MNRDTTKTALTCILLSMILFYLSTCDRNNDAARIEKEIITDKIDFEFEKYKPGRLPPNWKSEKTGRGKNGKWLILYDKKEKENVLAQVSKRNLGNHFNLAVIENTWFSDVEIKMNLKMMDGQEELAGGPVWRYQDANNYYVCLADPLKERLRVYKVINGEKRLIISKSAGKIEAHEWEKLKVEHEKDKISCWFDEKKYIEIRDSTFLSGKVGLCTKADAVVYFNNVSVEIEDK